MSISRQTQLILLKPAKASFAAPAMTAIGLVLLAAPWLASAQTTWQIPMPHEEEIVDQNGVDLGSWFSTHIAPGISIGSGDAMLTRSVPYVMSEMRDNFVSQYVQPENGPDVFSFNGRSEAFGDAAQGYAITCDNNPVVLTCKSSDQILAWINPTAPLSITQFTSRTGIVATYDANYRRWGTYYGDGYFDKGHLTSLKSPNGMVQRIYLEANGNDQQHPRILSVVNNYGYMLKYEYGPSGYVKSVTAINLSVEYCNPVATTCTLTGNWPKWTYDTTIYGPEHYFEVNQQKTTTPNSETYTIDRYGMTYPSGRYYQRGNVTAGTDTGYYSDPGEAQGCGGTITCVEDVFTVSTPAGTWTYNTHYHVGSGAPYTPLTVTNPDGTSRDFTILAVGDNATNDIKIGALKDEKGLTTTYEYSPSFWHKLAKVTFPEGNKVQFSYDARGNLIERRDISKGGTLPETFWSASYDTTCMNIVACNKPNWVRDANANLSANIGNVAMRSDYTYDPVHGGVLSETGPAVTDPVSGQQYRPQTRYTYTTMYAQLKNNTGGMVSAEGPIYLLTRVSTCRTATTANPASCIGTANETVKVYEYNSNNLSVTAEIVAAGDAVLTSPPSSTNLYQKTTYTYDSIGNVTSTDGPRTDVDDVSYKTYDVMRRPVFEIGVDPDGPASPTCPASGTGCLKRAIVKHNYDVDGREWKTETGNGNATNGSDFAPTRFTRITYDLAGRAVKTELVQP